MVAENIDRVADFHRAFSVPILETPTIPLERINLRINLIKEKWEELQEALIDGDIVEIADALADLEYVIHGTALEFGIPSSAVFQEVHRSNMTKIWPDGKVHYREDGKVLKPEGYSKADIAKVLNIGIGKEKEG